MEQRRSARLGCNCHQVQPESAGWSEYSGELITDFDDPVDVVINLAFGPDLLLTRLIAPEQVVRRRGDDRVDAAGW